MNGNVLYVDNLVIRNMREKHSLLSSVIIINIIAIGAYPRGYNCIIIYHVSCYFNRLIRPRPTAETTTAASRISRCNNESSEVDNEKIKKRTIFPIRGLDKEKNDISHPGIG